MNALLLSIIASVALTVVGVVVYLLTGELLILGAFLIFPSVGGLRALWRLITGAERQLGP